MARPSPLISTPRDALKSMYEILGRLEFRPQVYELAARERALASNDESS